MGITCRVHSFRGANRTPAAAQAAAGCGSGRSIAPRRPYERAPGGNRDGQRLRLAHHAARRQAAGRVRCDVWGAWCQPTGRPTCCSSMPKPPRAGALRCIIAGAGGSAHPSWHARREDDRARAWRADPHHELERTRDSLLSIVQMPAGVRSAPSRWGDAGAHNAGLLSPSRCWHDPILRSPQGSQPIPRDAGREGRGHLAHRSRVIPPGGMLGVLGGGQFGAHVHVRGAAHGLPLLVLDPDPDAPAGQLADRHIARPWTDPEALSELAESCAAATIEFENIPADVLRALGAHLPVRPRADAVACTGSSR